MVEKLEKIWLDGELVPWDEAKISVLTYSLHYGIGAFEGIRCYRRTDGTSTVFRLDDHIDRLFDTCKMTLMQPKWTRAELLAKREAKLGGYDEAILLDANGFVSEGSGENIFIVKKGELITPDLSSSVLEGITRDTIITVARELGLVVKEARITRDQLWLADEAFLTGTAAEITPIREVDDRSIGDGVVGPITKRLQARYFDLVRGTDRSHPEWLTSL